MGFFLWAHCLTRGALSQHLSYSPHLHPLLQLARALYSELTLHLGKASVPWTNFELTLENLTFRGLNFRHM